MKHAKYSLLILVLIGLLLFTSCTTYKKENYQYGVIETTSQENISYLHFYDENLNHLGKEKIKYGSMGDGFSLPLVYEGSMFIVPKGLYNKKEHTFIMEYDMETGEINKYDTGLQNMNSTSVDKDHVYGVNTMNFTSNIVKYTRETGQILNKEIPQTYIYYLQVYGDEVYAFGQDETEIYLYIFNKENLDLIKEIDISHIGSGQYYTIMKDGNLYFTTSQLLDGPIGVLGQYNIGGDNITLYNLKEKYPFQILEYEDSLIISHYDPVSLAGNKISIFNPADGWSEVIELDHNIEHLEIDEDGFIILGQGSLYRYNKDFQLIDSTQVVLNESKKYHYYTTGLIKNK